MTRSIDTCAQVGCTKEATRKLVIWPRDENLDSIERFYCWNHSMDNYYRALRRKDDAIDMPRRTA